MTHLKPASSVHDHVGVFRSQTVVPSSNSEENFPDSGSGSFLQSNGPLVEFCEDKLLYRPVIMV